MSTSRILFLRHFKTQSNLDNYLCGRSLLLPISESRDLSCSIPLDAAFCSSALRCRQTIEHVHFQNLASKIRYTDELLERNLGLMEGKPRDDMVQQFPNLFLDSKFRVFSTPPQGESFEDFKKRAQSFWNHYRSTYSGNILICSHNQMLKMLYFTILNKPISIATWNAKSFPYGTIVSIN